MNREAALEKLKNTVTTESGCWLFLGAPKMKYPCVLVEGERWSTHRLSYTIHKGPIPPTLTIDHLCRNKRCCNPDHLEAVTNKVNQLRGNSLTAKNARKTHCIRGHELIGENLYSCKEGRRCAECGRIQALKRYHKKMGNISAFNALCERFGLEGK